MRRIQLHAALSTRKCRFPIRSLAPLAMTIALFVVSGCHTDMWTQPKALPQQENEVLPGGQVSQLPVEGTIARGRLREDCQPRVRYADNSDIGIDRGKRVAGSQYVIAGEGVEQS